MLLRKVCDQDHPQIYWMGKDFCPACAKQTAVFKVRNQILGSEIESAAPSVFVGRYGYPKVNIGLLTPPLRVENTWEYDAPQHWGSQQYDIPTLINLRSSLINSRVNVPINKSNKYIEIIQEASMASKPVDVEINLKSKPIFRLNTDPMTAPTGPNANLESVDITSNPFIHRKVDKVVDDTDLKSVGAMDYLYKSGFDENFLTKVLSAGNLGLKKDRKLVPTRWSITAVDDSIGKGLIEEVKKYNHCEYMCYYGSYLGNHYLILLFPTIWSYELFETYIPGNRHTYTTDYENCDGRKKYANETAGGYYAARLPILEKLKEIKKQGSVLCLRFITNDYSVHMGVWVVREAIRQATKSKPIIFEDKELLIKHVYDFILKNFGLDVNNIIAHSKLLKNIREQSNLLSFF